jgi:predicted RNase H-like HicB family nuclease
MSESPSPPSEDPELDLTHGDLDEDDIGISTDTSGSVPGSPGVEEDGDTITVCRWDGCNQDLKTLDALVRHVHDCIQTHLPSYLFEAKILLSYSPYWNKTTKIYL